MFGNIFTKEVDAEAIAAGSTLGLEQQLLASAGQPAKTVLAVGFTTSGKVQGCSLGEGNVIEVYENGDDFNVGTVLYREFMGFGEPICFTGLSNGAIVTSTQGFYGFSEQVDGSNESPMPLLSYGLSFKETFLFAFRDSNDNTNNRGFIRVVNGPLESKVTLTRGDGTPVNSDAGTGTPQTDLPLKPWEFLTLQTDSNTEFILKSTNPIMACIHAEMRTNGPRFHDSRLIMPLTNDGITWPRSGRMSAPYDNTAVNWWTRDNTEGSFTVSPGSPINIQNETGASDSDYEPNGATRFKAVGLVSAFSGADSAGLEATPMMPTSAMSQIVAQPLFIADAGDGGDSGVAISSPYKGTAKIYSWDAVNSQLNLAYTVPLNRNNVTVLTKDDQNHPSAGLVANETVDGTVELVGQLDAGLIISDVPVTVVVQNGTETLTPTLRSQNGTTTTSIVSQDDETLSLGWTPATIKAEITEGTDGLLYKRVVNNSDGAEPLQGFIDYNDTTGAVAIVADTWTTIPNNGAGSFSNDTYKPSGISQLMDVSTGEIDPTELELGDTILVRNDYVINPNTNNAELEFRYVLGSGANEYTLQTTIGRLDDGSGIDYRFSLKPDLIYMGDTNTRDNLITLQVKVSSAGTLTNAGSVVQVIKRKTANAGVWELA
jgi:hypothetical protein